MSQIGLALKVFVEKNYSTLLVVTRSLCKSYGVNTPNAAEDLLNDLYIKLDSNWEKISEIPEKDLLKYIFSIIRNLLIDQLRRSNKIKYNTDLINDRSKHVSSLDHLFYVNFDLLEKIKVELTDEENTILELFLDGYKYKEIADQLHVPKNTVGVKISRIRLKVKNIFGDWK